MRAEWDVVVVGSGPNGLAAALTCARSGLRVLVLEEQATVGGGARTVPLGLAQGLTHNVCSAVHPLALASPFFSAFELTRRIGYTVPQASYANPLDSQPAAIAWHDLQRTQDELGRDGHVWGRLFGWLSSHAEYAAAIALSDKRSLPPALRDVAGWRTIAQLGAVTSTAVPAILDRTLRTEAARALLTGVAAHSIGRIPGIASSGVAAVLGAAAHAGGWPVVHGGSQSIANAMLDDLAAHGGTVRTGCSVRKRADLPPAAAYIFDTTAQSAAQILGSALPHRVRQGIRRLPHGDGASKVDFVLNAPIPWSDPRVGQAGTVHVGGSAQDMREAAAARARGELPMRPTVLLSDPASVVSRDAGSAGGARVVDGAQGASDSANSSGTSGGAGQPANAGGTSSDLRAVWTYAHVPYGCEVDVTERVSAHIERFAPGFRDTIVAAQCTPASRMHEHNANLTGGDIAGGAVTAWRLMARPRSALNPYSLGVPGLYLGSAATPPGPGVHGMCGFYAAGHALREVFGLTAPPPLGIE